MKKKINLEQLTELGIHQDLASTITNKINDHLANRLPAEDIWHDLTNTVLTKKIPFAIHLFLFKWLFPDWLTDPASAPAWIPEKNFIKTTNLAHVMAKLKINNLHEFHAWSVNHYDKFWSLVIKQLKINFREPPKNICDLTDGIETPNWLMGAKLNIIESCFNAPGDKVAIISQNEKDELKKITYAELDRLSNRIANSLGKLGFTAKDPIAIDMPMTVYAVAIYLAIVKMGGIVVSIADSFSSEEIATRLRIANVKAIFTQDFILRDSKKLPLYEKITAAHAPVTIVIPCEDQISLTLRKNDMSWDNFLVSNDVFKAVACDPMAHCNILFSSGTTAEPKAIPWSHVTAIKAASDGFFHHNLQNNDVIAWPTNLGWMMGPWLIFASLINQVTMALYEDIPKGTRFGKFVETAKVNVLGVVPTLVATWRQSHCMENLDWNAIKLFTSTGECSNPEDMLYLMFLGGYKPIIEYCGGTEIGGAYVTSAVIQKNFPAVFTTPALGINFIMLDEKGNLTKNGEVAIFPPSIGLSTELLNANHHKVYYANMPKFENKILRRHGDQILNFSNGFYSVLGRADDTMKLGAIKVSSAEIERALSGLDDIIETAAIAVSLTGHGPSQLIIYVVTNKQLDKDILKQNMQKRINKFLNPLFKIEDIVFVSELPKTASNKIMRRVLRKQYLDMIQK